MKRSIIATLLIGLSAAAFADTLTNQQATDAVNQANQFWADHEARLVNGAPGSSSLKMKVWVENNDGKAFSPGHWEDTDTIAPQTRMIIDATLTLNSQAAGTPGLLFIGSTDGYSGKTLTQQGWQTFKSGLLAPYMIADTGLASSYTVNLVNDATPCSVFGTADIMAGYGLLSEEAAQRASNLIKAGSRATPEHILHTFINHDMQKNDRYWKIMHVDCSVGDNFGGN